MPVPLPDMPDEPKKTRGRKPLAKDEKKRSYTISLTPAQITELERQAEASKHPTVSRWVVAKLRLDRKP